MIALITFILGLITASAFHIWKEKQTKSKLIRLLHSFSPNLEYVDSLPIISLVRREITHLYKKCEQLEKELSTIQDLLLFAPFAYLQVDEENELVWCNQQAQKLLQIEHWQPEQHRLLLELVRSYEIDQLIEETRKTQKKQVKEWVFYVADAPKKQKSDQEVRELANETYREREITLKGYSYPLPSRQVGVFIENQQPLVNLARNRDRAFSDLSHELKTPLTAISLVAEALQNKLENPEKTWVSKMLAETQRLSNLVKDWLEISKLNENPSQHLKQETLELKQLIFYSWEILEAIAQQKQVTLNYISIDPIYLKADKTRLTQVFLNLFDNAIKHSPEQGIVIVEVEKLSEEIIINIIDSGKGFEARDLPYIFERLYRGDPSRTRLHNNDSRKGSGLGLSIVKQIINAHNGSITAKNHPSKGGAWLQIKLTSNNR